VNPSPAFRLLALDALSIDDEASFAHVGLYDDLKRVLLRAGYRFRVPAGSAALSWDRALLYNLVYWDADAPGGDVLVEPRLAADVVCHAAWHHLAGDALSPGGTRASPEALLLGEAIASAFDLYLVGRLLGNAPNAEFLATQVPAMSDVAHAAGADEARFEAMLAEVAAEPERAFEDLRALLFDAAIALLAAGDADAAARALAPFDGHRLAALLHHYELPSWLLAARARRATGFDEATASAARAADAAMRAAPASLDWLERSWVRPALGE
jgi:hypothetical protein